MAATTELIKVLFSTNAKETEADLKKVDDQVNDLSDSFEGLTGIQLPDISGFADSFRKFSGLTGISTGMLAVAAGATAAAAAIGLYATGVYNADKANRKFLEITGELNTTFIANTKALAGFTGQAEEDIIRAAESIKTNFGGSSVEALALIEDGYKRGANANGEFLDSIKEYSGKLKKGGIDLKTFIALSTAAGRSGVFSDKALDAVGEAVISLNEMPKAAKDALAPLEDSVELMVKQKAAAGQSWEAIKLISEELNKGYITTQQRATIEADIFKGAGEDGSAVWVDGLYKINNSLDGFDKRISPISDATLKLSKSWELFKENIFGAGTAFDTFLTKTLSGLSQILNGITELFKDNNPTGVSLLEYALMSKKEKDQMLINARRSKLGVGDERGSGDATDNMNAMMFELRSQFGSKKTTTNTKTNNNTTTKALLSRLGMTSDSVAGSATSPLQKEAAIVGSGVKNLTINVAKQIETVNISSSEDPLKVMDMLKMALTQLILDSKLSIA